MMPKTNKIPEQEAPKPDVSQMLPRKGEALSVILEGIRSEVETVDSFSIKFSLLTRTPISKMKHLMARLPAVAWSGEGRGKAERILSLIEEAGGRGRIVESAAAAPASIRTPDAKEPNEPKDKLVCGWCGFPMREGATRCEFCLTVVGRAAKSDVPRGVRKKRPPVPPVRLAIYGAVIAAEIVLALILKR
jgi:hypothetical protein